MTESSHRKRTMANDQHRSQASLSFDKGTGMHTPLPGVFSRQGDRPSELCAVLHSIEADHPGSAFIGRWVGHGVASRRVVRLLWCLLGGKVRDSLENKRGK
ncbi:hypothetical protein TNIN_480421 [Trichonephila inaurata madagascariensis]|uniref:Uncharacterized protein n=1 Tax=Trichonephila inaurata madagascariensis TaxID=2747483 RepID=A0A8X6MB95_9ARAC|nr:hypothetical protein TNIN_480421 [Trichonephila inaurata madagascariensis]